MVERVPFAARHHGGQITVGIPFGERGQQVTRRGADLPAGGQPLPQGPAVDGGPGVQTEPVQQRVDQRRVVDRHHPEGVAGRVVDAAVAQVELVVPDLLRAAGAREHPVGDQPRSVRVTPGPALSGRPGRRRRGDRRRRQRRPGRAGSLGRQVLDHVVQPGGGRVLEVDVAVDPRHHPHRPQLLQPGVDQPAGLTEALVAAVPQGSTAYRVSSSRGALSAARASQNSSALSGISPSP